MDLFDQFKQFKTNLKTSLENRAQSNQRNTVIKPTYIQNIQQQIERKKTLQHHRSSTLFSQTKDNQEQLQRTNIQRRQLQEILPISQIQQISDTLIDCNDGQINQLQTQYVEELVKLSSIIMYKVKNSKFYS